MSLDLWPRAKALFDEARQLAPAERGAFLAARCADEPTLRAEVERLLAFDDSADAFFDTLGHALRGDAEPPAEPPLPEAVGPWRVLREVGRGGMGQVVEAERADGLYEQRVALKLVRPGLAPDHLARFAAERRMLAALQHPGIARLLDGGVTEDGRPYFAMEFVEGEPLLAHADAARLGVDERLRLFLAVCEAVAYAHRNLIVHRDLKPSNILVTEGGEPKLLDFGIAKLLSAEEDGLTRTGHHVMTPEYAAPEQITGQPVSTATDVYALGVLLFELLTGHRPYVLADRSPQATARAICEQEPGRPSAVVQRAAERRSLRGETRTVTPAEVAERRDTSTERLRRRLAGDLDVIALKALRKEPERRYASVDAFAADVRRHLEGRPVSARPDGVGYRVRKFVRRHRAGVAAAALAVLALAVGLGVALWQADRAEAAAAEARAEAERAEAVTQFMVDLFASTDPIGSDGAATTADEVLALGVERAEAELAHRPETQAQVFNVVANIYTQQGRYEDALPLAERALALRRERFGDGDLSTAESMGNLANLLFYTQDLDRAEPLMREALAVQERTLGPADSAVVQGRNNLGLVLWRKGELDEAGALLEATAEGWRGLYGDSSIELATTLSNLGLVHTANEDFAAAAALHREALGLQRALLGAENPNVGITSMNLARALGPQDSLAAAEAALHEAVAVLGPGLGETHPATLAARTYLGRVLTQQERYGEAEEALRAAYDAATERYGADFQASQNAARMLTALYEAWERPAEAAAFRPQN